MFQQATLQQVKPVSQPHPAISHRQLFEGCFFEEFLDTIVVCHKVTYFIVSVRGGHEVPVFGLYETKEGPVFIIEWVSSGLKRVARATGHSLCFKRTFLLPAVSFVLYCHRFVPSLAEIIFADGCLETAETVSESYEASSVVS